MGKKYYMAVTRDELSLPLAVAESPGELAKMRGVAKSTVLGQIAKGIKEYTHPGYIRVEVEEDEQDL